MAVTLRSRLDGRGTMATAGKGRVPGSAELSGELEQVFCVVATAHAKIDDGVVAGALAFEAQAR